MSMKQLTELIKRGEIEFYSNNKKLDTLLQDFGKYERDIQRHIVNQSNRYIVMKGSGLEDFLKTEEGIYAVVGFVMGLNFVNWRAGKGAIIPNIHVEADVEKLSKTPELNMRNELTLQNLLRRGPKYDWVQLLPELSWFELYWNYCLCSEIGGAVGYPGYEWPRDRESLQDTILLNALTFMIGTKEQLERYRTFAKQWTDWYEDYELRKDSVDYSEMQRKKLNKMLDAFSK